MKYFFLVFVLISCAHKEMDVKRALKLCRKIYGPEQELPNPLPKNVSKAQSDSIEIIGECYREYVERSRDPRDYVSCGMLSLDPNSGARLTVLSTQELLLPEIVLQCINGKFQKMKPKPIVKTPIRLELVFHHIAVTKN
ncbi:MAG: hypothetical protein K2P81_04250 [Bacteriovoracaceae bacterium]|nr:hypothetical protein [Bacteriovoracaceae bacterium]